MRKTRSAKKSSPVQAPVRALFPEQRPVFIEQNGQHCLLRSRKDEDGGKEQYAEVLANLTAKITETEVRDNGIPGEEERRHNIEGRLADGTALPTIHRLPAMEYAGMEWIAARWAPAASIIGSATDLRRAIDQHSHPAPTRLIYTHTGWRKVGGEWLYLTAGGAHGAGGHRADIAVDLRPNLFRYSLPATTPKKVLVGMRASLRLLKVADAAITVPLLSAMYRAVLSEVLPLDCSVFLDGKSSSGKSTVTAVFLSHFGVFTAKTLPGSWTSTVNHLESQLFLLKDAPYSVDDFSRNSKELQAKAERVLRSVGNQSARGRLSSNLSERQSHPPRGALVVNGEVLPEGESLLARLLVVPMRRELVNWDLITEAQKSTEPLSHAMAGFTQWLAPQIDILRDQLPARFEDLRSKATGAGQHMRIPEIIANLFIGFEMATRFAVEVKACTRNEAEQLNEEAWDALMALGRSQGEVVESHCLTRKFLRGLLALLKQGRVITLSMSGDRPAFSPKGDLVGLHDDEFYYLIYEVAYEAVIKHLRDSGDPFPGNLEALMRDLRDEGLSECDNGHLTRKVTVPAKSFPEFSGSRQRLLKLRKAACLELVGGEIEDGSEMREPGQDDGIAQ